MPFFALTPQGRAEFRRNNDGDAQFLRMSMLISGFWYCQRDLCLRQQENFILSLDSLGGWLNGS